MHKSRTHDQVKFLAESTFSKLTRFGVTKGERAILRKFVDRLSRYCDMKAFQRHRLIGFLKDHTQASNTGESHHEHS